MKKILLSCAFITMVSFPSLAQDIEPTPAMIEQIAMSEKLIAMGKARSDALLILAGIQLRSSLDGPVPAVADTLTSREDAIAAALEASADNKALNEVVKDVEATQSRGRMPICTNNTYGRNYCY